MRIKFWDCQSGTIQATLSPYAAASFVFYTVGVPIAFALVIWWHWADINADQELRAESRGDSAESNPQHRVRQRYQEVYNLFRPGMAHWRLWLLLRKFLIVAIGMMFSNNPLFQAR